MNALECRILTATCMHHSCACIAWLTVYGVTIYPAPEQGSGTVLFSSASNYTNLSVFLLNSDHKYWKLGEFSKYIIYGALCKILKMYAKYWKMEIFILKDRRAAWRHCFRVSVGVGGRHLAMSLYKLKAFATYLNWIMNFGATACLHCHCIDIQLTSETQNSNQSCSWGRCHVNTDWQQLHTTMYYTTGQDLTWPLLLYAKYSSNAYFLSVIIILTQEGSDGQTKSPNDCSNPLPIPCSEG